MVRLVLSLCIMFAVASCGRAIMCFECNSATNTLCGEKLLPDSLKRNCTEHDRGEIRHTFCRKIIQHVDTTVNGQWVASRVVRGCGWDDSKYKGVCYHKSGFGSRHEVCACHRDFCNGAAALGPVALMTSLLAAGTKLV